MEKAAIFDGRPRSSLTPELKLCYVQGSFAWFTSAPLDQPLGDDWDDAPYDINAGQPIAWRPEVEGRRGEPPYELARVAFEAPLDTPVERGLSMSVERINRGEEPWLKGDVTLGTEGVQVMAGCTFAEFREVIGKIGGTIYLPELRNA